MMVIRLCPDYWWSVKPQAAAYTVRLLQFAQFHNGVGGGEMGVGGACSAATHTHSPRFNLPCCGGSRRCAHLTQRSQLIRMETCGATGVISVNFRWYPSRVSLFDNRQAIVLSWDERAFLVWLYRTSAFGFDWTALSVSDVYFLMAFFLLFLVPCNADTHQICSLHLLAC